MKEDKNMKVVKNGEGKIKETAHSKKGFPLEGKIFVFTGELENYTRTKASELVASLGGKVGSAVSSKTTYVVVGEEPGSKLAKARQLNIPTLTEAEFIKMTQQKVS